MIDSLNAGSQGEELGAMGVMGEKGGRYITARAEATIETNRNASLGATRICRGMVVLLLVLVMGESVSAQSGGAWIDFRNFTYAVPDDFDGVSGSWSWKYPEGKQRTLELVEGFYKFRDAEDSASDDFGQPSLRFVSAQYGKLNGERNQVAAVVLNYSMGGTANWSYLYVFKFRAGKPELIRRLEAGSRADGGLLAVNFVKGELVLDFADTARRVGDCCSEGYVRVRYRLRGSEFLQRSGVKRGDVDLHSRK